MENGKSKNKKKKTKKGEKFIQIRENLMELNEYYTCIFPRKDY